MDASGNVYVLDALPRVQEFTPGGTFITQFGQPGFADGQLTGPSGIALDRAGNIYVADAAQNRVQEFSPAGAFVMSFGQGLLQRPGYLAFDASGDLLVSDAGNARVARFSATGEFVGAIGAPGSADGQFVETQGLGIDPAGNLFVVDARPRVEKFRFVP